MKKIYYLLQINLLFFGFNAKLNAQCSTASVVPYFEDFSTITANNQLPTCWWTSNTGNTCLTFASPTKYAAFFDSPAGVNHFYTDGIYLNAGITYSAAVWRKVTTSQTNWTDFSILVGPNQGPLGLVSIASSNGPVANTAYALLSGTFTVSNSGIYHVAVRGTSNASLSNHLQWDDLSITIPCGPGYSNNTPNLGIAGASTLCVGDILSVYTASGANTYTWTTGANTNTLIPSPPAAGQVNFSVQGTNTLSGCTATASINVNVLPTPIVIVSASQATVCPGQISTLSASGNAANYSWSNGGTNSTTTVSPTQATTYTLTGTAANGCSSTASQIINVHPQPSITTSGSQTVCAGEEISLTANGAQSYVWTAPGGLATTSASLVINLNANATYTLLGTTSNNCTASTIVALKAEACTGIPALKASANATSIYPNPASEKIMIQLKGANASNISLFDLSGREMKCPLTMLSKEKISADIREFPKGIYLLKIQSGEKSEVIKLIKE